MSAERAKDYFRGALAQSDYYIDGQELNGTFRGKLSKRLGIEGIVTQQEFFALCDNRHPSTGRRLTPHTRAYRTVGYDINFHVPKSVSIVHALSKDDHILKTFQNTVIGVMEEVEKDIRVRVQKGKKYERVVSGEGLYADFVHQTARPVEGFTPDPHLHAHCYVFNVAWAEAEGKTKSGHFEEMNRNMPYFQALFHKQFAENLAAQGYRIRPTEKSFEIEGVPQKVIDLFSKRTNEIGQIAKEKGITDAKELDKLGARTRAKKDKGLSMAELKADWRRQILELEEGKIANGEQQIRSGPAKELEPEQKLLQLQRCVDYTMSHCFERVSVMPMTRLLQTAYKFSLGSPLKAQDIAYALDNDPRVIRVQQDNREFCSTLEVLQEEQRMVDLAQKGRGKFAPLYYQLPDIKASGQQGNAIRHILSTPDMVSIVRGAAGAGKTTLMDEALPLIERKGKRVMVVAPSSNASRNVLREHGFKEAETVATLLSSPSMHSNLKDQVIWLDEAGMMGTKEMAAVLELATRVNARVILGGDTRQHASVARGDALRILNRIAGIEAAEVDKIYRQKQVAYRQAVADLAKGEIVTGFEKLDRLGSIVETNTDDATSWLAKEYVTSIKEGKSALVVSPTHKQREAVTKAIREELQKAGLLGKKEIPVSRLKNLNLTEAQKTNWAEFRAGQFIQFNQNMKGIRRGSLWRVEKSAEDGLYLKNPAGDKQQLPMPLPIATSSRFDVYKQSEIALAKGDKIQITKNGFDKGKTRLNNGQVFMVHSVSKKGAIKLVSGDGKNLLEIGADFGHLSHAHCLTSHASQGVTVDRVFVAQPAATFGASNAKQFYVSVSRGREMVKIYTDDKKTLLWRISDLGDRQSAMELVKGSKHDEHVRQQHVIRHAEKTNDPQAQRDVEFDTPSQNYDEYEPGI